MCAWKAAEVHDQRTQRPHAEETVLVSQRIERLFQEPDCFFVCDSDADASKADRGHGQEFRRVACTCDDRGLVEDRLCALRLARTEERARMRDPQLGLAHRIRAAEQLEGLRGRLEEFGGLLVGESLARLVACELRVVDRLAPVEQRGGLAEVIGERSEVLGAASPVKFLEDFADPAMDLGTPGGAEPMVDRLANEAFVKR